MHRICTKQGGAQRSLRQPLAIGNALTTNLLTQHRVNKVVIGAELHAQHPAGRQVQGSGGR